MVERIREMTAKISTISLSKALGLSDVLVYWEVSERIVHAQEPRSLGLDICWRSGFRKAGGISMAGRLGGVSAEVPVISTPEADGLGGAPVRDRPAGRAHGTLSSGTAASGQDQLRTNTGSTMAGPLGQIREDTPAALRSDGLSLDGAQTQGGAEDTMNLTCRRWNSGQATRWLSTPLLGHFGKGIAGLPVGEMVEENSTTLAQKVRASSHAKAYGDAAPKSDHAPQTRPSRCRCLQRGISRPSGESNVIDRLDEMVGEISRSYDKLILLVGSSESRKDDLLRQLSTRRQARILDVGAFLGRELLTMPIKRRRLAAPKVLRALADSFTTSGVLLMNRIEILFDQELSLDPLQLLRQQARELTTVAVWPGEFRENRLEYATPEHPEHMKRSTEGIYPFVCDDEEFK